MDTKKVFSLTSSFANQAFYLGWNEMYRNNVTPWNLKKASPSLVDIEGKIPKDAKCIVPGCGEGFDWYGHQCI